MDHCIRTLLCTALLSASCVVVEPEPDGGGAMRQDKTEGPAAAGIPPGTIIAFGGNTAPAGWILCDGRAISREEHPALFAAIGSAWGTGGDGDGPLFNVPDLRARFLRGADRGASRDPDRDTRTEIQKGGNAGDQVGSLQGDATRNPRTPFMASKAGDHGGHTASSTIFACGGLGTCSAAAVGNYAYGDHTHMLTGGDKETRPENAAVNFLIKQ